LDESFKLVRICGSKNYVIVNIYLSSLCVLFQFILGSLCFNKTLAKYLLVSVKGLNATFSNISVISWRSVL